jgi:NADH dehydrogenase
LPGNVADAASVDRAMAGARAVVHLAAVTHARRPSTYTQINVAGTRTVVAAAKRAGIARLVHISTRAISLEGGAYSTSKRRAEEVVLAGGVPHVIVRLPETYGGGGMEGVDQMLRAARGGRRVPVVGSGSDILCPLHIDDAVGAIVAALEAEAADGRSYTLTGECMTAVELVRRAAETYGTACRPWHVPVAAVAALSTVSRVVPLPLVPDQLTRLRATKPSASPEAGPDLGFRPRSLTEGLVSDDSRGTRA